MVFAFRDSLPMLAWLWDDFCWGGVGFILLVDDDNGRAGYWLPYCTCRQLKLSVNHPQF